MPHYLKAIKRQLQTIFLLFQTDIHTYNIHTFMYVCMYVWMYIEEQYVSQTPGPDPLSNLIEPPSATRTLFLPPSPLSPQFSETSLLTFTSWCNVLVQLLSIRTWYSTGIAINVTFIFFPLGSKIGRNFWGQTGRQVNLLSHIRPSLRWVDVLFTFGGSGLLETNYILQSNGLKSYFSLNVFIFFKTCPVLSLLLSHYRSCDFVRFLFPLLADDFRLIWTSFVWICMRP